MPAEDNEKAAEEIAYIQEHNQQMQEQIVSEGLETAGAKKDTRKPIIEDEHITTATREESIKHEGEEDVSFKVYKEQKAVSGDEAKDKKIFEESDLTNGRKIMEDGEGSCKAMGGVRNKDDEGDGPAEAQAGEKAAAIARTKAEARLRADSDSIVEATPPSPDIQEIVGETDGRRSSRLEHNQQTQEHNDIRVIIPSNDTRQDMQVSQGKTTQCALRWIIILVNGLVIGYFFSTLGGLLSLRDFMDTMFHEFYSSQNHSISSRTCKYHNLGIMAVSALPSFFAFTIRIIFIVFCNTWRSEQFLLAADLIIIVGILLIVALPHGVCFIIGSIVMGCGLGILSMVVPSSLFRTASARKKSTSIVLFYSSVGVGTAIANLFSYLESTNYMPHWEIVFTPGALVVISLACSVCLENEIVDEGAREKVENQFKGIMEHEHRPALVITLVAQVLSALVG